MSNLNYSFEAKLYKGKFDKTSKDEDKLLQRLNFDSALWEKIKEHKGKVLLQVFHRNINWYRSRITRELCLIVGYWVLSICIIVFMPIIVFWLTDLDAAVATKDSVQSVSSAIVILLTSVLGLQKLATEWMNRRQLLGVYHEAIAGLKSKLYAFEDRWNGVDKKTMSFEDFDDSLELVIREGRAVADTERQKYMQAIQNPQVNVDSIMSGALTQASGFMKNFQSKQFSKKLAQIEEGVKSETEQKALRKDVDALKIQVTEYEVWLKAINKALAANQGDKALTKLKTDVTNKLGVAKSNFIDKKSRLA